MHLDIFIGFIVPTSNGRNVRSFSINFDDLDDINKRSNERYDQLIDVIQVRRQLNNQLTRKKQLKDLTIEKPHGQEIMGVCLLRELTYFDVGRFFMADSLHNIFIGTFVRNMFAFF